MGIATHQFLGPFCQFKEFEKLLDPLFSSRTIETVQIGHEGHEF